MGVVECYSSKIQTQNRVLRKYNLCSEENVAQLPILIKKEISGINFNFSTFTAQNKIHHYL